MTKRPDSNASAVQRGRPAAAGLIIGILLAHASAGADPAAATRDFGFRALEIYAFLPGTTDLVVEDVNGDGRDDIIFVNNAASRLEILLRKPRADDADPSSALPALDERFENAGMLVDQQILFHALADLDGSGRKDVVIFGPTLGLQIRRQAVPGSFGPTERIHVDRLAEVIGLRLADVSGNGLPDIVLGRRNGAEILWSDPRGGYPDRTLVTVATDACSGIEARDVSGDGQVDLLFFTPSPDAPVRLRTRDERGGFMMETLLSLPPQRYLAWLPATHGAPAQVGGILRSGLGFRSYTFERRPTPDLLSSSDCSPGKIPLLGMDRRLPPAWMVADFDGDGLDDVLVAAPELNQLHWYPGTPDGLRGDPVRIDSLMGVQNISRTASGDILVVSRRENAAALHPGVESGVFPAVLPVPGSVLTGAARPGTDHIFLVCRDEDRRFLLLERRAAGADWVSRDLAIRNEPSDMIVFAMDPDAAGILLFMPHGQPLLFRVTEDAVHAVASTDFSALAWPLGVRNVTRAAQTPADAILAAFGRAARWFERTENGYAATRQFNPGNEQADVVASCLYPGPEGQPGVMIYDQNARNLLWFARGETTASASVHLRHAPGDVTGLTPLDGPDRRKLLLVARDSLNVIATGAGQWSLSPGPEYMSAAEKPVLQYFQPVRMGRTPTPRVALVDTANRAIEWIRQRDGEWIRDLAFEVFHDSGFAAMAGGAPAGIEPRAVASGDLDGNGISDMIVLVHDKLLIYLGE